MSNTAPAGTPAEIVKKLNAAVVSIQSSADMKSRLAAQGAEFAPNTPEEFGAFQRAELAKWSKVIQETGSRVD